MDRLSKIRARFDEEKADNARGYMIHTADVEYLLEQNAQLRAEVGRLIDLAGGWKEAADRYHAERNQLQAANRWIPVGERLPDNGVNVLCKWGHDKAWHKGIVIGYQHSGVWYFPEISMSYWTDITHWQPLPEPPKGV